MNRKLIFELATARFDSSFVKWCRLPKLAPTVCASFLNVARVSSRLQNRHTRGLTFPTQTEGGGVPAQGTTMSPTSL
jgi:hypothetical protein